MKIWMSAPSRWEFNLLDCASDDIGRFTDNIYTRITTAAKDLVRMCDEVGDKYGIPVVNKRISVSPIAVAGAPFNALEMLRRWPRR
jgi:uncharacterized protein (UPF0210 family)